MTVREIIDTGSVANDPDADTLRSGATKINNNFGALFNALGGDSSSLATSVRFDSDGIQYIGTSFITSFNFVDPTSNKNIQIPDYSGAMVINEAPQTLTNKTIVSPILSNPEIYDSGENYQYTISPGGDLSANQTIFLPVINDSDTFVLTKNTQTLTNKTLTTPTLTDPSINDILDVNGANIITLSAKASAVNNITIENNSTGNNPAFSVTGTDSDINLVLRAKNRGVIKFNSKVAHNKNTQTTSGDISRTETFISFNSGSPMAAALKNGNVAGEIKKLVNAGAGTVTITPDNFANGTSFQLTQNDACEVIWDANDWFIISNKSSLTIT